MYILNYHHHQLSSSNIQKKRATKDLHFQSKRLPGKLQAGQPWIPSRGWQHIKQCQAGKGQSTLTFPYMSTVSTFSTFSTCENWDCAHCAPWTSPRTSKNSSAPEEVAALRSPSPQSGPQSWFESWFESWSEICHEICHDSSHDHVEISSNSTEARQIFLCIQPGQPWLWATETMDEKENYMTITWRFA